MIFFGFSAERIMIKNQKTRKTAEEEEGISVDFFWVFGFFWVGVEERLESRRELYV